MFMSSFDVHVNKIPVSGKFKIAKGDIEKENEKNLLVIDSEFGR